MATASKTTSARSKSASRTRSTAKKAKPAPVAAEPTETAEEALTNGCTKINTRLKVFPLDMRLRWINDPKADIFQ